MNWSTTTTLKIKSLICWLYTHAAFIMLQYPSNILLKVICQQNWGNNYKLYTVYKYINVLSLNKKEMSINVEMGGKVICYMKTISEWLNLSRNQKQVIVKKKRTSLAVVSLTHNLGHTDRSNHLLYPDQSHHSENPRVSSATLFTTVSLAMVVLIAYDTLASVTVYSILTLSPF